MLFNDRSAAEAKFAEAEPLLLQGFDGMKRLAAKSDAAGKRRLIESAERLIRFYEGTNRPDQAARWRNTLQETQQLVR